MDFTFTNNYKCSGTVSWSFDFKKAEKQIVELHSIWKKQEKRAEDIAKEINSYLEKKCKEFCKERDISFLDWTGFSEGKYGYGKFEVYYKDELVCGAKVYNMKLELY